MANNSNKDPVVCDEERRSFIEDLHRFHQNRGTQFDLIPKLGGREVDLHRLYRRVVELGGWRKVCNELQWEDLQTEFQIPASCSNGEQALKYIYVRFLYLYEKLNFLGEDPDQKDPDADANPARKKATGPFYGVPLKYNYSQHQIPDLLRKNNGFSLDVISLNDYDKLEKALLSGLPNEVDFAINVCTLLSNEGRHVLRLDKSKQLLHLLLAHIGVFNSGNESLYDLYRHGWIPYSQRDFLRFWYESVQDESIKELITMNDVIYTRKKDVGNEVLHLGNDIGVHSVEGQRVTQLAVLLRNLSFEDINQKLMASNAVVFKFLMLCVHSTYGTLKQLALDTLGNLAAQMVFDSIGNHRTKLILDFITKSFCSDDKFTVVRALEILGKLCQVEKNESCLTETLLCKNYEDVFSLLTVHDIQLIVHTLEALYQLSELGQTTTTKIAQVRNAVDVLIDLITVDVQSFGANSLIGIKVVEYVPPPSDRKGEKGEVAEATSVTVSATADPSNQTPPSTPAKSATPAKSSIRKGPLIQVHDMEATTMNWFRATYEPRRSGRTFQIDLFTDYLQFCHKFSLANVLQSTEFSQLVRVAFPQTEIKTMTMPNGDKDICFLGFSKRTNPKPFHLNNPVPKSISVSVNLPSGAQASNSSPLVANTPTPTLRQRLMEPPQHPIHQPIVHSGSGTTPNKTTPNTPTTPRTIAPKPVAKQLQLGSTVVITQGPRPPGTPDNSQVPGSPSVKRQKIAPKPSIQQTNVQFPSIHNALQTDSNVVMKTAALLLDQDSFHKSTDTNLIKSLLAKKLSQNLVGRQNSSIASQQGAQLPDNIIITSSDQSGPEVLLHSQTELNQHNTTAIPSTSSHSVESLSTNTTQPSSSQVPSTTSDDTTSSLQNVPQKRRNSSELCPVSPKSSKSQGSPRPSSPRALSPRSKNLDLEVCGEVEKAKNFVRKGTEATIERVENKGLQEIETNNSVSSSTATTSSPSLVYNNTSSNNHHQPVNSSSLSTYNTSLPLVTNNTTLITLPANGTNTHSKHVALTNDGDVNKTSENIQDISETQKCVKMNGNPNIRDKEVLGNKLLNNNTSVDPTVNTQDKTKSSDSNDVKINNCQTNAKLVNGNNASPMGDCDLPPSPIYLNNIQSGLINGISDDSMDSLVGDKSVKTFPKEQITKLVEKASKMNGISHHIGNGDHVEEKVGNDKSNQECGRINNTICKESLENHRELNGSVELSSAVKSDKPVNKLFDQTDKLASTVVTSVIINAEVSPPIIKIQSILGEKRVCDTTRHVPTPETSRDSELSSDSFASSTAESVPEKHSIPVCINIAQPTTISTVVEKASPINVSEKKAKCRKRSRSTTGNSININQECKTISVPVQVVDFMCEWAGCNRCFENARSVFCHVVKTHTLVGSDGMCQWAHCQPIKRQRWSLITHLQDLHCSDSALRARSAKRLQPHQTVVLKKPAPTPTPPAPSTPAPTTTITTTTTASASTTNSTLVYPNDAAMQAIKRFLVRPPFQEFLDTGEGPVTKHIRLTAALILRNIARYSPVGRSLIRKKEGQISYVTMSAVESSTALANCLWEILNQH
ncbi:AT-rich interactive domain-containing protein 2 isoform X1 [Patella vulgata]|uniref:AT-rich interactive domain-containing protein 2 isoform X1 n=1 Tax=Patella vulgata TaxID=6465 RepID=UPI00217F7288|nr:AT-rich interactive domain-containing protein 2 isoform X1 [Patella vulgata]